jgi:glycosyltransferase involved in cell wall biosynthesis
MVGGGIERVTLTLIEEFQKRGIDCCLALRHANGDFIGEANALTDVVEVAGSGMHQFIPRLSGLIRDFEPTHIVTAMQARVAHPEGFRGWLRNKYERSIGRFVYGRVDAAVAVSEGIRKELVEEFGVAGNRAVQIYNPIIRDEHIGGARAGSIAMAQEKRFVAIGRLSRQKGFDVLVRALADVDGDWQLDIYGGGVERHALAALVDMLELGSRVFLRGHTDDPYSVLDEADWLVMPSRFEGFGVVLVEALARGVPAIASDCPHGPREILDNGRFGALIPPDSVSELAIAVRDAIDGRYEFDSEVLRSRARDFSISLSIDKWVRMLADASGSKHE